MMLANIFAVTLAAAASAEAWVIDRQAQTTQYWNTRATCSTAFFGGCCAGTLDEYGSNASCESHQYH